MDKKIVVSSGNKRLLSSIAERISVLQPQFTITTSKDVLYNSDAPTMLFTSDFNELLSISKDDSVVTNIIYANSKPFEMDGVESFVPGFFFNEMRKTNPGEFLADAFSDVGEDADKAFDAVVDFISARSAAVDIANAIETAGLQVKWDSWSFNGGRDDDGDVYALYKNGERVGYIFETDESISVDMADGTSFCTSGWVARKNTALYESLSQILNDAWLRDDAELIQKLTKNGEICMPRDFGDISRSDVLSGAWDVHTEWADDIEQEI